MIKTEIEGESVAAIAEPIRTNQPLLVGAVITCLALIGAVGYILSINHSSVQPLPANPSKYSQVQALPLSTSAAPAVQPTNSNQSSDTQSATDAGSLGASYTGLQSVPQTNGSPKVSPLQSTNAAQNTGQSINTSLPY